MSDAARCLVIGDINIDFNLQTAAYPKEGGEAHADESDMRLGGSGCNTAIQLHLLGMPCVLAGQIGDDVFGDFAMRYMQIAGLPTNMVRRQRKAPTGFFMNVITADGERTMFGNRGANAIPISQRALGEMLGECDHLHFSGYTLLGKEQFAVMQALIRLANEENKSVSFDPGYCTAQNVSERILPLLPMVDYFLPSLDELQLLVPNTPAGEAIRYILDKGCGAVVLKMGGEGSRFSNGSTEARVEACRKEGAVIYDTTGAGDVFNAGFLYRILSGQDAREALRFGNKTAFAMITQPHGLMDRLNTTAD